jgi:hypothetical protein
MKDGAMKASMDMSKIVEVLIDYYSGDGPSIVIETAKAYSADMREQLDGLGGAISAAYFEGFDLGSRGTIRKLTESHVGLLNTTFDRVKALLVALQSEDFAESHQTIMKAITEPSFDLARATSALMLETAEAMSDGDLSSSERDSLRKKVQATKDACATLAEEFDTVRRTFGKSIHPEVLGESFFVLTLSAYARLTWEFTETLINNPPAGGGNFFGDFSNCIASTWNLAAMNERYNLNFAMRYTVGVMGAVLYCVFVMNWVGTTAVLVSLLISTRVSPDIQASLDVLLSVIVASLTGAILFNYSCMTGYGDYVLPAASFCFWCLTMYSFYSKSKFAGIGLTAAAVGAPRIVALCPADGDVASGRGAMWGLMVAILFAATIIVVVEIVFAVDRASNLAVTSLKGAFESLQEGFTAFWEQQDISTAIGPVAGHCGEGSTFNLSAHIEPRFWRTDWKTELYKDLVSSIQTLRLDALMLESGIEGSTGSASGLFDKFKSKPGWNNVRKDLDSSLKQASLMAIGLQKLESGVLKVLQNQLDFEDDNKMDELEDLPALLEELAESVTFPDSAPESMEDDEICKISVVLVMLQATCKHIAHVMSVVINNA